MCYQHYDVIFKAKNYQIKSVGTRKLVVEAIIRNNIVYVLKEKKKSCFLSKIDES